MDDAPEVGDPKPMLGNTSHQYSKAGQAKSDNINKTMNNTKNLKALNFFAN